MKLYIVGKGGCAAVGGAILAMPRRNIDLLKPPENYLPVVWICP